MPPQPKRFCKQIDLERALGGAAILAQLSDKNGTGNIDAEFVSFVLDAGSMDIASYIQKAVDIASLQEPYQLSLVFKTADACAWRAWLRGSYGQGIPQHVQAAYDLAIAWAKDVGDRAATLGTTPKPALDPPAKLLDYDPQGSGVSIRGFKKGFR